jgi:hypothetical protein
MILKVKALSWQGVYRANKSASCRLVFESRNNKRINDRLAPMAPRDHGEMIGQNHFMEV